MSDVLQLAIVTTAAAAAMVLLVWPYVRRRPANTTAPCANCSLSKPSSTTK